MRKLFPILFFFTSIALYSQTNIGGTVSVNTTLDLANSPYQVTSSLVVNAGVTLTIKSGSELQFNDNLKLDVNGTLIADGVTFTSSNASPSAGVWTGIELNGNTTHTLTNCQILYGQYGINSTFGSIDLSGTSITSSQIDAVRSRPSSVLDQRNVLTADNLTISGAGSQGINADRTSLILSNSTISGTAQNGILLVEKLLTGEVRSTSSSISSTSITGAGASGISISSGAVSINDISVSSSIYPVNIGSGSDVTYTGTNNFSSNDFDVILLGTTSISKNTTLRNAGYPYYFNGTKTIENGAELIIESGNIIKMHPGSSIDVEGKLTAEAAVSETINFTSWYDDNIGGDSNNDSNNTAASTGQWRGIDFFSQSDDLSVIRRADIRWISSVGAVNMTNASPTIDECNLQNAFYGAQLNAASAPTFTNNVIAASDRTPIAMSFEASPTFSNNSFSDIDNEFDAIGLLGGALTQNGSIIKRNFTDIDNVTYVMLGSVEVPAGLSLTIAPGVVIKSQSQNFIINGELIADGTVDEPIVFTSVNDDNFGNPSDTKNDGTNLIPTIGNFGGIYFSETSESTSLIDNAIIKFANYTAQYQSQAAPSPYGTRSYHYQSALAINSADPTISNTQIEEANFGIDMRGISTPILTYNSVTNTAKAPFRQAIQTSPAYSGNTFSSVGWNGVAILPELINYSATLSTQAVAGFDNILYIMETMAINETAEITISEGVQIKMPSSSRLEVFGGLKVVGTSVNPVIVSSIADDNTGPYTDPLDNDTESNGNATDPSTTEWGSIRFYETSDDAFSSISHAKLLYGGRDQAPIRWTQASASVDNTEIDFSANFGLHFEGASNPIIDNVSISTSMNDPLAMSYFSNPTFTNITFSTNGSNGINLIDTQLNADATVAKRDIAGINNIGYIMNDLTIDNGATLTINPGVVLKLSAKTVQVNEGSIQAVGTPTEKIIFTSIKDDSRGGDTNIDGNGSVPAPNDWRGIVFRESTIPSNLQHAEFRYGGDALANSGEGTTRDGTIISDNNALVVDNCIIQLSRGNAFGIYGTSTASLTNNRLENIDGFPVHLAMFSNPTFSGNVVENIKYFAFGVQDESYNQSGTFPFRSFAGVDSITYAPFQQTGPIGVMTINAGTKITVPPGMHFKMLGSSAFEVNGELHIAGTEEKPVVFTDINDDSYGRPRDTQNNGETTTIFQSYSGLLFNNISEDASLVENTIFRYADESIELVSASPTVDNNLFEYSNWGMVSTGISEPIYTNNTFKDLIFTPFTTSLVAYPATTSGNTMEGTTVKAIRINTETLTQDTVLTQKPFAGINNIPYLFQNYTVGLGVKLTIDPGVILKFYDGAFIGNGSDGSLNVKGALVADGDPTTDGSIIFTSGRDDFYGGDTNSDSTHTSIANNLWSGITFENESSDSESIIDNVIIRDASRSGITLNSASPTISNTLFLENGNSTSQGGLLINGASNPTLSGNDFIDNGGASGYGINNTGSFTIDATGSWWGDNSGPFNEALNPNGEGDEVRGDVTFDPWSMDNSQNPITGDVSLNGNVSAFDAALTLQDVAAVITFEARQDRAGDVSGDGTVSAMDASFILQFAAGIIQSFPAEAENKRTTDDFSSTHSEAVVQIGNATLSELVTEISIPISISNVTQLHALSMKLPLGDHLEFIEFEKEGDLNFSPTLNVSEGNIFNLTFGLINGLNEDFKLGNLKLKLNSEKISSSLITLPFSHLVGNETNISSLSQSGEVYITGSILGTDNEVGIIVYPNPMANHATVTIPNQEGALVTAQWIDVSGKVMFEHTEEVVNGKIEFKNIQLLPGIYFIKVNGDQMQFQQQIIVGQ